MGKSKRGGREFTREQRLVEQNRQLKQELTHLRKQISRLDSSRIDIVKEMCTDYEESRRFDGNMNRMSPNLESLKKEWSCKNCSEGFLEIHLYSKLEKVFYYRKCNNCRNRTLGQRYDEKSVKGIMARGQK